MAFRPIPQWSAYEVNERGEVRRIRQSSGAVAGRILKPWLRRGYEAVHLSCDGLANYVAVHRIVYAAFVGTIPLGYTVNHIDGNKLNNHWRNLNVLTRGENVRHAASIGLSLRGERNPASKLTDKKVRLARRLYASNNFTFVQLAARFDVSYRAINLAIRGESWKHVLTATS